MVPVLKYMDSSSGMSSDTGMGDGIRISGSEENLEQMDQKKRKRMISNRESARRSRLRKQNHINGLKTVAAQLRDDKSQILAGLHMTTQLKLRVEAENAVLIAQAAELSHRLHSLSEIASYMSHGLGGLVSAEKPAFYTAESAGYGFMNNLCLDQSQPIFLAAAAADVGGFLY
ncbi:bZIP transcription factor 44-like [Henckelia pumila]|uniref:bZIP transcription factor 44-like n=1 Tax=Henckelia pumila TaxID=405737 RepID=UPI003C6DF82E